MAPKLAKIMEDFTCAEATGILYDMAFNLSGLIIDIGR